MTVIWSEASTDVLHRAEEIIKKFHPDLAKASIAFVFRSEASISAGHFVLGKASKVPDKYRAILDYDFLIWLAADHYASFEDLRRNALIDHELCHCSITDNDEKKDATPRC